MDFFKSFYNRFVLRELLGKMIPGAILLGSTTVVTIDWLDSSKEIQFTNHAIPFVLWILFFGLSWLSGLAIQQLGEKLPGCLKLRYFPPKEYRNNFESIKITCKRDELLTWYRLNTQLLASSNNVQQQVERLGIIKDACGVGWLSIAISFIILIVCTFLSRRDTPRIWFKDIFEPSIPAVIIVLILIVMLLFMHKVHVEREYLLIISTQKKENGNNDNSNPSLDEKVNSYETNKD